MFESPTKPVSTLLTAEIPITRKEARRARSRRRRRGATARVVVIVGGATAALAAAALSVIVFAPQSVERAQARVTENVQAAANDVAAWSGVPAADLLPTLTLGAHGPAELLDACDGTFTQLSSYETQPGLQPVYAAHNGCQGGVILPLQLGDEVRVQSQSGDTKTYAVVDLRDVDKHTSTTADVTGMQGTLLTQTCYWGEPVMRFVGLAPVGGGSDE